MGSEARRERDKQRIRASFLDAARTLLVSEGVQAVTMRRVADVADYSAAAIYVHFGDKDALIKALCVHDFSVFASTLREVSAIVDPRERLLALARSYARFATEYPQHYRLLFLSPGSRDAKAGEDRNNPGQGAYELLEHAVHYAIAQGMFPNLKRHPGLLAQSMWAGMHGVVALQLVMENDTSVQLTPLEQRIEIMTQVLLGGLSIAELPPARPRKSAVRAAVPTKKAVALPKNKKSSS